MEQKNIEELKLLIEDNNSDAMYELGNRYLLGKDISTDYEKAIYNYEKAVSNGNIKGKYGIAKCYYYGRGFKTDYEKAYKIFYELMTKFNDTNAKYYIGLMYYNGQFVEKSYEKAYTIFKNLAEQNNDSFAKEKIADMYYRGLYVEKDFAKAFEIYKELYENESNLYAIRALSDMYFNGYGTEKSYEKARKYGELYLKSGSNVKYTAFNLGYIYFYGKETDMDYNRASYYFKLASDEKYDDSYFYLWQIYNTGGYGIQKDVEVANKYLRKIEKDFCKQAIYATLAMSKDSIDELYMVANYGKERFSNLVSTFPKGHPCLNYFYRLKSLTNRQYAQISNIVALKIKIFGAKEQEYFSLKNVSCHEDIDIMSEIILYSSDYETMDDYLSVKLDKERDKKLLYIVGSMIYDGRNCEKDTKEGLDWLEKSAKQNYKSAIDKLEKCADSGDLFATYKIAEIEYNQKNYIKAIEYLNKVLNTTDKVLLVTAKSLLGHIFYYGSNNLEKDYTKALEYFNQSIEVISSKVHIGKMYFWGTRCK